MRARRSLRGGSDREREQGRERRGESETRVVDAELESVGLCGMGCGRLGCGRWLPWLLLEGSTSNQAPGSKHDMPVAAGRVSNWTGVRLYVE